MGMQAAATHKDVKLLLALTGAGPASALSGVQTVSGRINAATILQAGY